MVDAPWTALPWRPLLGWPTRRKPTLLLKRFRLLSLVRYRSIGILEYASSLFPRGRNISTLAGSMEAEEQGPSSQVYLETLRAAYMNEKFAPEILQHKSDLVDTIQQLLETQAERITELSERDFLLRSIYEMERERVEYLLRVYLRTRLQKITKYAIHIGTSVEVQSRLSESERSFAQQYLELYQEHMDASIWNSADCEMLPAKLKDLSKMATLAVQPKTSSHVFARVMRDCEPFTLSDRAEEQVELKRGELVLLPYQPLANLISDGSVCLT